MFNGRFNNNGNGVTVNTRLYTSFSDTCMLVVGAWNDKLSLKFHPSKGFNADGIRQYAQDNTEIINTSLTADNATALLEGINETILPALNKEGTSVNVSITMGQNDNRKVISVETDGKDVFITAYVGVSEAGIANPANKVTHKFNKKEYMVGYDPSTGSGTVKEVNADLEHFIAKLKEIYVLDGDTAHANTYIGAIKNAYSNRNAINSAPPAFSAPSTTYTPDDNISELIAFN